MERLTFFLINLLLANAALAQSSYSKEVEEKIRAVEENTGLIKFRLEGKANPTLRDRMAFYRVKGLSIAVVHNYKVEWAKGYGWADSAEKRPVTISTLFEPGSISKSLNAMAVLKLAQENRLDLYTDINAYLRSWTFPYDSLSKNKKINLANLLSHSAGLSVHGFAGYFKGDTFPTIPQLLDGKRPANSPPVRSLFEPGLKFLYSGGGTMISELIVMDVTKKAYDQFLLEAVFKPIGMTHSSFTQPPPPDKRLLLATGYTGQGKAVKGKYPILIEQAAGGLWTTPTDLCKFIIEIQLSLKGQSNKVLNREMTEKMLSPYIDSNVALGVVIENRKGTKYFQHHAGNQGFSGAYYASETDGNGVAVILNSDNAPGLINEVVNSVANAYQWKGFYSGEISEVKKTITVPDSILATYVGAYRQNGAVVTIRQKGHGLIYFANGSPWNMHFTSLSGFFNLESLSEKQFVLNTRGEVEGFSRKADGKDLGLMLKLKPFTLPDSLLKPYTGNYTNENQALLIQQKEKHLWLYPGFDEALRELHFISADTFYLDEDFGTEYKFVPGKAGVYAISVRSQDGERIFTQKP